MPETIIDPKPIGGHYYRVTAWDKARPGLPTSPAVDKAVWRKHNLLDDVVETTEELVDAVALDIAKENIPANGIGNWTVADFKGVERDESAFDTSYKSPAYLKSLADMGCHAQGHDVPTIKAALKEIAARCAPDVKAAIAIEEDKKPEEEKEALPPEDYLAAKMALKPLGLVINEDPAALCAFLRVIPVEPKLPVELEQKAVQLLASISPAQQTYDATARAKVLEKAVPDKPVGNLEEREG